MRFLDTQAVLAAALLLLSQASASKHSHGLGRLDRLEKRHNHLRKHSHTSPSAGTEASTILGDGGHQEVKRGTCSFPTGDGLVAVTPGSSNGGWALSPDETCTAGSYCPYACPSGQVSMQWDPSVTSYTYPGSMNGGLKCNSDGTVSKPIPDNPYCADGTGTISVVNNMGGVHAVCQTVLPGNEAMLIPTQVDSGSSAVIAVPGTSYWCSTAAHYYHNGPGVSTSDGCIWGDGTKPVGNWAPYVSGANTDSSGETFVKVAWNPIYTGESTFKNDLPSWGIKVECPSGGCNGLPCSIDPSTNGVNEVTSSQSAAGAGGATFCVVTVPKGSSANIVVFEAGSSGNGSSSSSKSSAKSSSVAPSSSSTTPTATSTTTTSPSTTTTSTTTSTTPSTTSTTTTTSSTTTTTTTSKTTTTTSKSSTTSSSKSSSSSSLTVLSSSSSTNTSSASPTISNAPHVFFENDNSTVSYTRSASATVSKSVSLTSAAAAAATSTKSGASKVSDVGGNSAFGLVVVLGVAVGYIL